MRNRNREAATRLRTSQVLHIHHQMLRTHLTNLLTVPLALMKAVTTKDLLPAKADTGSNLKVLLDFKVVRHSKRPTNIHLSNLLMTVEEVEVILEQAMAVGGTR